jgi:two-component system, oxyanion-binding sensor
MEISVGFMPLLDCALLVAAYEMGFAADQGIDLKLIRETSWANIRDRVIVGHLDVAQMLGPMVVAETVGAGQFRVPLMTPVALGSGANAITLGGRLWDDMLSAGASLGATALANARTLKRVLERRAARGTVPVTLAMVFPFSCHHYQLRDWLSSAQIDPDRDTRLIVLPPSLLVDALRTGQVDGFCVGEPWSSIAVEAGLGTIVATACDIWPSPGEKVLGMRTEFAQRHPDHVAGLVRAVAGAAEWLDGTNHRNALAVLLSQARYVGASADILAAGLNGSIHPGLMSVAQETLIPRADMAERYYRLMCNTGQCQFDAAQLALARQAFREDIFEAAVSDPVARRAGQGSPAGPVPAGR